MAIAYAFEKSLRNLIEHAMHGKCERKYWNSAWEDTKYRISIKGVSTFYIAPKVSKPPVRLPISQM